MHDGSVPTNKLIAYSLWGVAALLLAAAWATWFDGVEGLPLMLGFTSCMVSAIAAVAHVRCYAARICGLVRITGGLTPSAEVRSLY